MSPPSFSPFVPMPLRSALDLQISLSNKERIFFFIWIISAGEIWKKYPSGLRKVELKGIWFFFLSIIESV